MLGVTAFFAMGFLVGSAILSLALGKEEQVEEICEVVVSTYTQSSGTRTLFD